MRQAHLTAPRTIEWRESNAPAPERGEMLVKIRAALTCGTDLKTYRRGHPKLRYGPFGHEASGDVIALGKDVDRFAVGDAVMWVQTAPCGECARCIGGSENLCEHLFDEIALGAYGDELLLPAKVVRQNVYKKPDKVSYIEAAFLEPFACVVHGWNVLRRADARRPLPRDVTIVGAGTIGLLHLIYAVRAGVDATVIARGEERRNLAASLGAKHVVDAEDTMALEKLAGTAGAVIECAGGPSTWTLAATLARPGARVVLFSGLPSGAIAEFDAAKIHYGEIALLGAFHFSPGDVREAYELLGRGGIDVKPLVSGIETMERIVDVFERLDRREGHKFALVPGSEDPRWR